ncbi:hypothetical protein [Caulobacter sp. Root655]|uniref:hypothetical protein n=1 Tax=Caulobacter sp. Root655 TaxID=1736578 RepID=UPI000A51706A|nr:hypothetical protein [Caulobacter sp. Root655]
MPKSRDRRPPQEPPEPWEKRPSPRRREYVLREIRRRLDLLYPHEHGHAQQKAPDLAARGSAWSDEVED